jgi:hypothetical protein
VTRIFGHTFGPIGVGLELVAKGRVVLGLLVTIGRGQRFGVHIEVGAVLVYVALHLTWEG